MNKLTIFILLFFCNMTSNGQAPSGTSFLNSEVPLVYDHYTHFKWGVSIKAEQPGFLFRAGMYRSAADTGVYKVQLWINEGLKNHSVAGPFLWASQNGVTGWTEFEFPSPVELEPSSTYILSLTKDGDPKRSEKNDLITTKLNTTERNSEMNTPVDLSNWYTNNSLRVAVSSALTPGSISPEQTICYDRLPEPLRQDMAPGGGAGNYRYQWQMSENNETWNDINEAINPDYSPPSLKTTTWFRRRVSSGRFKPVATNPVKISVIENLTPGTIGASQSLCHNSTPSTLGLITFPTGGGDAYSYQWQSSTDRVSWTDIPGAVNQSLSPPSLTQTTWFRLRVTSGNCASEYTQPVGINVYPALDPGTIGNDQSVCYESEPDRIVLTETPSGGTGSYVYQWQRSADGTAWNDINGAASPFFDPPALSSEIWYRLLVESGPCSGFSNTVHISVLERLLPGTTGNDQTICYNTVPSPIVQLTAPSGGTGSFTFQWQSSADNSSWTNINNSNSANYTPPALTSSRWYRRAVTAGCTSYGNSVRISIYPQFSSAQLHDSKTIPENSSTTFYISFSGGTPPYTVYYTRNGSEQTPLQNYSGGTEISTGTLSEGRYTYVLTGVVDSHGCSVQSTGSGITINVSSYDEPRSNKALAIVNSSSSYYSNFTTYLVPYLDNFGIPYDICNVNSTALPALENYALIIFGHRNVYSGSYPLSLIETAVSNGTGLVSFDPRLFDFQSSFNSLISSRSVNTNIINISNTSHFITRYHANDSFNSTNNVITMLRSWSLSQNSNLIGGSNLVTMSSGGQTIPLLQVSDYGSGRIVKWTGYDWMFESYLGPVYGMDDLLWRGMVWAARKPFIMQGLPPMVTMRVDDVEGNTGGVTENFVWVEICNEFGIIPWCGTYYTNIRPTNIPTLKRLTDNNLATSSPHAINGFDFIYFNHNNLSSFDAAANVRNARNFYNQHGLRISSYVVPHFYEISSQALGELSAMGVEFIGTHMLPDNFYNSTPPTPWINCAPYRINRNGYAQGTRPVYYGGYVTLSGYRFFNCLAEIRDDGSYEWFPDNDITNTSARGIRHLRRSFNSMVLASLFTHEYFLEEITQSEWREIIRRITSGISEYSPLYCSTDYALQYIRAKSNIRITNVIENTSNVEIRYSGTNDMATKCYMFYDQNGQISFRLIDLPTVSGSNTVTAPK